jgi:hypothetical protein
MAMTKVFETDDLIELRYPNPLSRISFRTMKDKTSRGRRNAASPDAAKRASASFYATAATSRRLATFAALAKPHITNGRIADAAAKSRTRSSFPKPRARETPSRRTC